MKRVYDFLSSAPKNTLLEFNSCEYVALSNLEKLWDNAFLTDLKQQTKTNRINFFSKDLKDLVGRFGEPPGNTYSWYLCVYSAANEQVPLVVPISADLIVERLSHARVVEADRIEIISLWQLQYVEFLQANRSREQKMDLLASIEETLSEGTHFLYRKEGRLIGHGAFVEDVNEVLELPNLYVHLWTHQAEPLENRRKVLSHYFSVLHSERKNLVAGIAVNNIKSLKVFCANGFEPVLLSMGVYT